MFTPANAKCEILAMFPLSAAIQSYSSRLNYYLIIRGEVLVTNLGLGECIKGSLEVLRVLRLVPNLVEIVWFCFF